MKPKLYKVLLALVGAAMAIPAAAQTSIAVCQIPEVKLAKVSKITGIGGKTSLNLHPILNTLASVGTIESLPELTVSLERINRLEANPNDQDQEASSKSYTEKTKRIVKTYRAGAREKLSITNEYGKISVNVWPKNEIKVDLVITAYEASESKAEDLLNKVTIAESSQGNVISFKTNINRDRTAGWWGTKIVKGKPEEKRGVEVAYVVYMPTRNALEIKSSLGSVALPDFEGPVDLEITHGSLKADKLSNPANKINVSYGSVVLDAISSGNISVSYGSLRIGKAENLTAKVHAGSSKIVNLSKSANLNLQMGGCRIDNIDADTKKLDIVADKSSLTLGIDPASVFNFDVSVTLGGFKYEPEKVSLVNQKQDEDGHFRPDKTRVYKGKYGIGNSNAQYTIKSSYGSVKFL